MASVLLHIRKGEMHQSTTMNTLQKSGLISILVFLVGISVCWSQVTTGSIRGVVNDPEEKPIPGATVTITSPALIGGSKITITNEDGTFRFPSLPVGTYTVAVTLEGFQTMQVSKIDVRLNATATVPVTMKMTGKAEEVTVVGEPLIDVTQSGLSTNYSNEILQETPTQRNSFNILQVAPGVSPGLGDSNNINFIAFGSNPQSNSWNIDGVEMSWPEGGTTLDYEAPDAIEEIQVMGVGAPAEYGNHLGAVFNVVTKKGSNNFHGGANYYFQNNGLTGNNVTLPPCSDPTLVRGSACADLSTGGDPNFHRNAYHDFSATLGGPIKRDRIWLFFSVQTWLDNLTTPGNHPQEAKPFPTEAYTYDFKVSGLLGKKNEWNGFYHPEGFKSGGEGLDPNTVPTAFHGGREFDHSWGGGMTSTVSEKLLVEAHYAGWSQHEFGHGLQPNTLDPFIDYTPAGVGTNPVYTGGVTYPYEYLTSRHQVNGKISYFADKFLKSQHEFRFGVQWSRGLADTLTAAGANGFYTYNYYGNQYRVYQEPYRYGGITHDLGIFMDDTVTVNSRLTLNLGMRFDHNSGDIPSYQNLAVGTPSITEAGNFINIPGSSPSVHMMTWNKISPRLGFVWQMKDEGKSVLNGSFGVYYDHNVSGNWDFPSPSVTPIKKFVFDPTTGQTVGDPFFIQTFGNAIDPNIQPPRTLQYSLGYEQQVSNTMAIGTQYIYKDTKDYIGFEINGGLWAPHPFTDPFTGNQYTLLDLVENPTLVKGNSFGDFCDHIEGGATASMCGQPRDYWQKYHGVVLTLTKRLSRNWAMNASYTWSKSWGLGTRPLDQGQSPPLFGTTGSDPNTWVNAEGNLQADRRNMFRIQGVWNLLPLGLDAAMNFDFSSGRPHTRQFNVALDQGNKHVIMERDIHLDPFQVVDLTIGRKFLLSQNIGIQVNGTIYNLLNEDTVLTLNGSAAQVLHAPGNVYTPGVWIKPRRLEIRVGMQF